ncbi:uncharacterized protein BDZ83DRAFT_212182 [Colletotrichum acutatum]|uniref:Uncharacterized protein n=1 Tax=Glomerella acutata TaxID=27357 RepID=A0AAD8XJ71_GLOAC|nr:uncharacterized protein BDZ83DRAFT_212182 [Colletotrichum acutatum]KAK1727333.1 hypothetical protein BDZ83DRAFT_212182 [Colletotrichum acutatum]
MPASSRAVFTQPEVNRARVQPSAVTRVNPALADWLANTKSPQPGLATPATPAMPAMPAMPANMVPARSDVPKAINQDLANWLTPKPSPVAAPPKETPNSRASSSVPVAKIDSPETSKAAVSGNTEAVSQSSAPPLSLEEEAVVPPETTVRSKPSGLGRSLRIAHEAKVIREQNNMSGVGTTASSNLNAKAFALFAEDIELVPQPQSNQNGQAPSLHETVDNKQYAEASFSTKTETSAVKPELKFGSVEWALAQLESGRELPGHHEFHARMAQEVGNKSGAVPVTDAHSGIINNTESFIEQQETTDKKKAAEPRMQEPYCNCPKRSHPIIGLAASCYNTDSDGDHDLTRMKGASDAVKNKFAVNVILHEHSNPDCPKLLQAAAQYPLHFGASPAAVDDPDDHLQVIQWKDPNGLSGPSKSVPVRKINSSGHQNNSTGASNNLAVAFNNSSGPPLAGAPIPQPSAHRRRGINDSMWA